MSVYAFAETIAILRADAENGIPADADKRATDLRPHLPSLSLGEVITLISGCIDAIELKPGDPLVIWSEFRVSST